MTEVSLSPSPSPLPPSRQWRVWVAVALTAGLAVYVLRSVLLPFVAGAAVAYFLDPVADWLERRGFSRLMATVTITAVFLSFFIIAVLFLVPLIEHQVVAFAARVPGYVQSWNSQSTPLVKHLRELIPHDQWVRLQEGASAMIGDVASVGLTVVKGVLSSSLALINIVSLLVITPVVSFYLLRDWDSMVGSIDSWLPRQHAPTIRSLLKEINEMLAGFVRGQATVCLCLAAYYSIGLSLTGLDLGLVVGICVGLAAVIPFVGSISGFVVSVGLALAQFADPWSVGMVVAVYAGGQFLEGNVLSPLLVGGRIRLHPVWLIFALLAGGSLFGFVGILLAVPSAAVIGVLTRHFLARYLRSRLYHGHLPF